MNLKGNLTSKGLQGSIGKSRMQGILGTNPAAIPITVDNALSLSSTNPVQNRVITAAITNRLLSDDVKAALLQIAQKVAYSDTDGQDYYDDLYDALYPPVGLDSIVAVFDSSATIYNTDTLDDLKQYLTVTAYYTSGDSEVVTTYTLSGSMDAGTQTITVSYGDKTTTFSVTVVEWLVSISAVFTQGSATIYDTDSLDTLKQYLVVTATYADSTTATIIDYTLSGTLIAGTSTITVSYIGKTDTFSTTVLHGFLYTPDKGLLSQQSYVNYTTISRYFTESISGDYLKIYSAKSGQSSTEASQIQFKSDYKFSNSAFVKMEFLIADEIWISSSNTTTPGTFSLFVANDEDTSSASFGMGSTGFGRYNSATANVRFRKNEGSGSAWLTNTISLNTLHTLVLTVENGAVSVSLDDNSIVTNGSLYTSTTYASVTGLRIMRSNTNVVDIRIKSLEVRMD